MSHVETSKGGHPPAPPDASWVEVTPTVVVAAAMVVMVVGTANNVQLKKKKNIIPSTNIDLSLNQGTASVT